MFNNLNVFNIIFANFLNVIISVIKSTFEILHFEFFFFVEDSQDFQILNLA